MNNTTTTKKATLKKSQSKSRQQKKKPKVKNTGKKKGIAKKKKQQQSTTTTSITKVATTSQQLTTATPSSSSSTTLLTLPTTSTNTNLNTVDDEQNNQVNQQEENQPEENQPEEDQSVIEENDSEEEPVMQEVNEQQYNKINTMAAASIADSPTYSTSNTLAGSDNQIARIAGPIVGVFAGVAFLAVAMFIVVRNRNKRLSISKNKNDEEGDDNNENNFHDIPLNDDEGIAVTKEMPSLILHHQEKEEKELQDKKLSFISTTSTAYHSMSSTLVASRANSSVSTKQRNNHESWKSAKSYNNRDSDICVSPISISTRIQSFLMTAERQQLHHERPNLLNHFEYHQNKTPIETYKAQLANILEPEEDNEPTLPFHSLTDINEFY